MKFVYIDKYCKNPYSRAPQGARGLKCLRLWILIKRFVVAPRKGRVG